METGTTTVKNLHAGGRMRGRTEDNRSRREKGAEGLTLPCYGPFEFRCGGQHFSKTFLCFRQKYCRDWISCVPVFLWQNKITHNMFTLVVCFCQCGLSPTWIRVTTAISKQQVRPLRI